MLKQQVEQIMYDEKVSGAVAGSTLLAGAAAKVGDFLHAEAASIGLLAGAALSVVLIFVHLNRNKREAREAKLREKKLELEIEQLKAAPKGCD